MSSVFMAFFTFFEYGLWMAGGLIVLMFILGWLSEEPAKSKRNPRINPKVGDILQAHDSPYYNRVHAVTTDGHVEYLEYHENEPQRLLRFVTLGRWRVNHRNSAVLARRSRAFLFRA